MWDPEGPEGVPHCVHGRGAPWGLRGVPGGLRGAPWGAPQKNFMALSFGLLVFSHISGGAEGGSALPDMISTEPLS